ncbi:MAG: L,D-transpeptidase [Acidimicrobiia bacterium]
MAELARSERRESRRVARRRRRIRVAGIAALVIALGGGAFALLSGGEAAQVAAKAPPSSTTTTAEPAFTPFVTATTNGADLVAYTEPVEGAAPVKTFSALTEYGFPRTLLVTEQQEGWVQALLPMRPTGSLGWVRASDITLGSTTLEIKVSLSAHQLVLLDAGVPVLETPVAIGKEATPTTVGQFFVTDPLDLSSDPNSDYGVFAIGISGYSDVLTSFRGGDGQLAIHGGAWESQLGTGVSAGCVRVLNDTILQIAGLVPLGAPVTITA